jgi:N-acetylglucosamine-6-phosphate deacetylase
MRYFDLQVNGYAGVDFNREEWTVAELERACELLRAEGVEAILATVITAPLERMAARLRRLVAGREASSVIRAMIAGFHIEGPFLNAAPGYIGAHPPTAARPADLDSMQRLLDAAAGLARIVTLAPESDADLRVTRYLAARSVVVSGGHCDPSTRQLRAAIDAGLTMFTHLGNGCPLQLHRHDNIIQRVLAQSEHLAIGFIADGVHVPFEALGNYLRCAGLERSFVVTDAIAAAGLGPGTYPLGDQLVVVDEQLATWSADRSHLMGSAGTMPRTAANLREALGMPDAQIERLLWHNPRQAIGETS